MSLQMKLTAKNIIAIVYVLISFVSLGFVLVASLNYNNYYWEARSAMLDSTGNDTVVQSVRAIKDSNTGGFIIHITVSATNPTGYQGLILDQFALILFCFHTSDINQSIFTPSQNNLQSYISPAQTLGPDSTITKDVTFSLNSTQSSQLKEFNQTYNGDIRAHTVLTTSITTFFDSVFGPVDPKKEQILPILWS